MNEVLKTALPVAVIVAVPSLMALIGILFGKRDLIALEARMEARFNSADAKTDRLSDKIDRQSDKIDRLAESVNQGILALNLKVGDNTTRISLLEEKLRVLAETPPRRISR